MGYTDEIYKSAAAFLDRELNQNEQEGLSAMCAAAEAELTGRLKTGVSAEELSELFVTAAGVLALSLYIQLGDTAEQASSVKLGSLSVSKRGAGAVRASASALRKQAEAMLAGYLEDRGFEFLGVRV